MENKTTVILVVGASRGIGRATALALAAPGTHLVLAARDGAALDTVAAEVRAEGAEATAVPCDVTAEPHVRRLIAAAANLTGQIDTLINSAGGAIVAPLAELTLADWERSLRVSLTSVFLTCKHAAFVLGSGGLIVNVASVAARQAFPNWSAYAAAKHAVLGFSGAIREELRPRGIRVTVVLPAATDTALWDEVPGEWNRANMLQPEDVGRAIAQLAAQPPYMATEELVIGHVVGRGEGGAQRCGAPTAARDRFMPKETTRVAGLADIPPGGMRYVEVDGLPIALANVEGAIYAFGDACRHEGGPLSAGVLIGDTVTCPWHGWTYSVRTGKAIVPPVGIRIPTYEVTIAGEDVYVTIDWPEN